MCEETGYSIWESEDYSDLSPEVVEEIKRRAENEYWYEWYGDYGG